MVMIFFNQQFYKVQNNKNRDNNKQEILIVFTKAQFFIQWITRYFLLIYHQRQAAYGVFNYGGAYIKDAFNKCFRDNIGRFP